MVQTLADTIQSFEIYPLIKTEELEGKTFFMFSARGPYTSKTGDYAGSQYCVFSVMLADTDEKRDLMLSWQDRGQRAQLVEAFTEAFDNDRALTVGPLTLTEIKTGEKTTFYRFDDVK